MYSSHEQRSVLQATASVAGVSPPTLVTTAVSAGAGAGWQNTSTGAATGTFDTDAGDILIVVASSGETDTNVWSPPTNTGGWTFTLVEKHDDTSGTVQNAAATCMWWALNGSNQTGRTVSSNFTGTGHNHGIAVLVFRGSDGIGAHNINIDQTQPAVSVTTTQANSAVVCINGDWNAVAGTRTYRQINGANPTEHYYGGTAGSTHIVEVFTYADAGATGSKTAGLTAPAAEFSNVIALEVKGSSAGLSLDTTIGAGGVIVAETTGSTNPITTASFSTAANVRLVALCTGNASFGGPTTTHTVSGAGLSWTKEVTSGEGAASTGTLTIWHAYSVSALSGVTVSLNRSSTLAPGSTLVVVGILGAEVTHGGAENTAVSSSGTPSCAVVSTRDGSYILSVMVDYAAVGAPDPSGSSPAQTELNDLHVAAENSVGQSRSTDTVAIGTQTMGWTGAGRDYRMGVIEIRAAITGINYVSPAVEVGQASSASSFNFTITTTVAAGTHIIAAVHMRSSTTVTAVSDSKGNAWQVDVQTATTENVAIISGKIGTALTTSDTIDITLSGSALCEISAHAYTGLDGTSWFDQSKTATGTSNAPNSGNTATTTQADELLFCGGGMSPQENWVAGASYTRHSSSGLVRYAAESRIVAATGAYNATYSIGASQPWTVALATYKAGVFESEPPWTPETDADETIRVLSGSRW